MILPISTTLFFLASSFLTMAEDEVKAEEKSYSEKLKEVYEKGLKGAKEKYAETVGDGKELTGKSKQWVLKDIENMETGNIKWNLTILNKPRIWKKSLMNWARNAGNAFGWNPVKRKKSFTLSEQK